MKKEIKESSLERKIRKHEVSFSAVQGDKSVDYLDEVIYEHSGKEFVDFADNMIKKVDKKVLQRALFKLPKDDREILQDYLVGTKQVDIAQKLNIYNSLRQF